MISDKEDKYNKTSVIQDNKQKYFSQSSYETELCNDLYSQHPR